MAIWAYHLAFTRSAAPGELYIAAWKFCVACSRIVRQLYMLGKSGKSVRWLSESNTEFMLKTKAEGGCGLSLLYKTLLIACC